MKLHNVLISFFCLFSFVACGTDTGNPSLGPNENPYIGQPVTSQIASIICQKVTGCFSPPLVSCEAKVKLAQNIPTALGLNESNYANLNIIQNGVDAMALSVNQSLFQSCLNQIYQTQCNDPAIQISYSVSDPENLNESYRMLSLSPSCSQFIY